MRKLTLSIALATLATAGVAIAAPAVTPATNHGKNWGGDVTRAQAETQAAQRFARMDANGDGKLDSAYRAAMQAKMFDRIDANHDGSISRDEFAAMHRGHDGDQAMGQPGARDGKRGGHHMGMRGHRGGGMGMMKAADTNNDGAISQAEFTAGALKRFDAADANHDGTVTQAERKAARDAMRAQWKAQREARQQG
jgi:Ca2+-binding EF-hand superfamily protein